ncbi:hypothetical protein MMC18_005438 [Xylographa bjoerkii]|nr:hypothetical protein [Xylographa bjoerkii]
MNNTMLPVQMERTAAPIASSRTDEDPTTERSPSPEITFVRKVQHDASDEPAPKRLRVAGNDIVAAGSTSLSSHATTMHTPEAPKQHWIARGWYAKQYHALANAAWDNFPLVEFQEAHQKTRQEVWDVFMGVIRLPLLKIPGRGPGVPRGGLGEVRMKEMRLLEKEAQRTIQAKDEKIRKEVEEARNRPSQTVLCDNCKKEYTRMPTTIAEAQAGVRAAIEEFNRRSDILQAMIEMEKESSHNAELIRRRDRSH